MITLKTSDGETFEVEDAVAMESQTLKHMVEDNCADATIPLDTIKGEILAKVIEYLKRHHNSSKGKATEDDKSVDEELKKFDEEFVNVDRDIQFELIMAANFLSIRSLLDLVCKTVADSIKDTSVEDVRKIFSVKNDFTPEEERDIRKENKWAFE